MSGLRNVADVYPLTPAQAGILYHHLADPGSQLYHEQVRFDLIGPADLDRLHEAWRRVVERHAALRSSLLWDGVDEPLQLVRDRVELPWEVLDLRSLDPAAAAAELDRVAARHRDEGLDLRRAPPMRLCVAPLDGLTTHVIWDFHHVLVDGWSAALVVDEVIDVDEQLRTGARTSSETAPPFRDYISWLQGRDQAVSAAFWRDRLGTLERPCRLPVGRPVSDTAYSAGRAEMTLSDGTTAALKRVAREERVTLNTIVQTAWAVLLARYTDRDDVVFGVTTSGRPADLPDVERIVGMFLNVVPMRIPVRDELPVRRFVREVMAEQLAIGEHEHSSLVDMQRASGVASGQQLFDTVLIYENYPVGAAHDGRTLQIANHRVTERTSFPIALMVGPGERIEILSLYNAERFDRATIERMLHHLAQLLDAIASNPDDRVGDLDLISDTERQQLIDEWNATDAAYPHATVAELFERQVSETPTALAVIDGERRTTFAELHRHGAVIADRLAAAGVRPGDPVGVAVPRSVDMVAAVVGVLLAGGVYVPLDPEYPLDRLRLIAEDARLGAIVGEAGSDGQPLVSGAVTVPATMSAATEVEDRAPLPALPSPSGAPLFITFTSGSTGRPKGVPVPQRGVLNRLQWQWDVFPHDVGEVGACKTTLNFVDHVFEIWGNLLRGHPIAVISEDDVRNPRRFVDLLGANGVRRMTIVPSHLRVLLDSVPDLATRLPHLTFWAASGEPTSEALAERFRSALPDAVLLNFYGMSEATVDATWFDDRWGIGATGLPIGRPIANMRVHVLDRAGRLKPVGVPGEIHVGGIGLTSGYLHRPDLTAERFVDDPFRPGERLYRTGDVGRWLACGQLEYLGRIDDQVKVRGHRVEPAEIEVVLRRDVSVRDVVVTARPIGDTIQLVAYVVGDAVDVDRLRGLARTTLPGFMVPAHIVVLDEFPRTPNGKIDRRALPVPGRRSGANVPATPTEAAMVELWCALLDVSEVDPDDNFFDAGGDSLIAVRLFSQIHRMFDNDLPLATLFDAPTPRALARVVDELATGVERGADEDPRGGADQRRFAHVVPIVKGRDAGFPVFCVHGAGGNVLNFRDLAAELGPDQPFYGVQARGVDGARPPHQTLDELCDDYGAEIEAIAGDRPIVLAGYSGGGLIAYELAQRRVRAGRAVELVALLDTFHPAVQPRRTSVLTHLRELVRSGPRYVLERGAARWARDREERDRRQRVRRLQLHDGPIPVDQREHLLYDNTGRLLQAYSPEPFPGRVVLYSAPSIKDYFRHVGPDLGWWKVDPTIEVVEVGGSHLDLVLSPNVEQLARHLRGELAGR